MIDISKQSVVDATNIVPQMGYTPAAANITQPPTMTSSQILTFNDQSPAYTYEMETEMDPSFRVADVGDDSLQAFFSRPVKTQSYTWNQSVALYEFFNPWQDFFGNKRVINRVSNFNIMRAKLHVKVVINGNGFFYGRLLMNYTPLQQSDSLTLDRGLVNQDNIEASQRPHIYLDPTTNQGGELVLPFFWPYNGVSIPSAGWGGLGACSIRELVGLQHANGATDSVTISVFVHATEVELAIPTAIDAAGIVPQMALDEYGQGMISKPATAVAKVAGMLAKAPTIGPYARATQMAAQGLAMIASAFGFSRPTSVSAIMEVKPTYGGNMATANLPDTSHKLAIDCKNEVTIDPRVTGLKDTDEMDLVSIAKRESYLTQFPWPLTATPEQLLWNARVTPIQFDLFSTAKPPEIHMIPACWATLPFKYWRGTMKFRFQVVSSNYHKGRLKIVYDPNFTASGNNEYNIAYTYIVDIGETKDFTIECGWGNYFPYCTTYSLSGVALPGSSPNLNFGNTPFPGSENNATNGTISVFVVNDLTVPNSSIPNDVTVNVFVSMSDDFEVAVPEGSYIENYAHFPYQMAIEPQMAVEVTETDKDNTMEPSAPVQDTPDLHIAGSQFSEVDATSMIFAGESIKSLRQLAKRYQLQRFWGQSTIAAAQSFKISAYHLPVRPMYRGFTTTWQTLSETEPSQITTGNPQKPYAITNMTYLSWILPAYTGYRGALRHKYAVLMTADAVHMWPSLIQVSRAESAGLSELGISSTNHTISTTKIAGELTDYVDGTLGGAIMQPFNLNNVLEVENPYYERNRFIHTRSYTYMAPNSVSGTSNQVVNLNLITTADAPAVNGQELVADYIAAGEDFNCYFFTNTPVLFYYGPDNTF